MAARNPSAASAHAAPEKSGGGRDDASDEARREDLVRMAQAGDRDAFAALYERHTAMVHGVLISMVPPQEAGDLAQDVFVSALRSISGLAEVDRFGPWLCAIARNRGRDALKGRGREVDLDSAPEPSAEDPGVARDEGEEAARVLGIVRDLPEAYRETLSLRLVEGLSGPQIAELTGLTHGSVRVNLHRGMKLLRERLAEIGWNVEGARA